MVTRIDISRAVAQREKITIQDAYSIVGTTISVIAESLEKGTVQLADLGTFEKITLPSRVGRNPRTGEPIHIPERVVVRFKPSEKLIPSRRPKKTSRRKEKGGSGE